MTRKGRPPRRNADGWVRCHTCGGYTPPERMPCHRARPDGFATQCHDCRRPVYTRWYDKLAADETRWRDYLSQQRVRNRAQTAARHRSRRARVQWALGVLTTQGYTWGQIAREAGVCLETVRNWRRGRIVPWPGTLDRVERLAARLIFDGTGDD